MSQQNTGAQPAQARMGEVASEQFERKLWFDYLAKLDDRDLQSARASGATTWALTAVVAAILYRGVPSLPRFLSLPGVLGQTAVLFSLEVDFFLLAACLIAFWVYYCTVETETRLKPERHKRTTWVFHFLTQSALLCLAVLHFWTSFWVRVPTTVRLALISFGAYWAANIFAFATKKIRGVKRARRLGYALPLFTAPQSPPQTFYVIGFSAFFVPLSAFAAVAAGFYLRYLSLTPNGWLPVLSAATQTLVLVSVLSALIIRAFHRASKDVYLQLEQDILLEKLSAAEIKSRFIAQALGPSAVDWFRNLAGRFPKIERKLNELSESAAFGLKEIESIDETYRLERAGRAKRLLQEMVAGIESQVSAMRSLVDQLHHFRDESHLSEAQNRLFENEASEWEAKARSIKERASSTKEIMEKLHTLAGSSKGSSDT